MNIDLESFLSFNELMEYLEMHYMAKSSVIANAKIEKEAREISFRKLVGIYEFVESLNLITSEACFDIYFCLVGLLCNCGIYDDYGREYTVDYLGNRHYTYIEG